MIRAGAAAARSEVADAEGEARGLGSCPGGGGQLERCGAAASLEADGVLFGDDVDVVAGRG